MRICVPHVRKCCRQHLCLIFTLFLQYRKRLPLSPCRTSAPSTAFSSMPLLKRCGSSLPILNISAPKSVSSPFSTRGARPWCTTRICIVSYPAVDCHPTASVGSLAGPISFSLCGCCLDCSAVCFSSPSKKPSTAESYGSPHRWSPFATATHLSVTWHH